MSKYDGQRFIQGNFSDRRDEEDHHPHYHAHTDDDEDIDTPIPFWAIPINK
jgi:hypothetical protein